MYLCRRRCRGDPRILRSAITSRVRPLAVSRAGSRPALDGRMRQTALRIGSGASCLLDSAGRSYAERRRGGRIAASARRRTPLPGSSGRPPDRRCHISRSLQGRYCGWCRFPDNSSAPLDRQHRSLRNWPHLLSYSRSGRYNRSRACRGFPPPPADTCPACSASCGASSFCTCPGCSAGIHRIEGCTSRILPQPHRPGRPNPGGQATRPGQPGLGAGSQRRTGNEPGNRSG